MAKLLVGTYTSALPHVAGRGAGVYAAQVAGGSLGPVEVHLVTADPSYLAVDGPLVYAVDEAGATLSAFRDSRLLTTVSTDGAAPCHVALSPDGRFVLVAHWGSGSVSVHERAADGSLGTLVGQAQNGTHAHMSCFDPATGLVLVPYLGTDAVVGYRLGADGTLTEELRFGLPAGTGPRHLAFATDASHLYVVGELASTVTTFGRAAHGWRGVHSVSTLPVGFAGSNTAAAVRVHGDWLFVSNRGHDSVAVFALDPLPRLLSHAPCGGRSPRDLVVTPDGAHVFVANQDSDTVVGLAVRGGGLRPVSSTPIPTPVCLVIDDSP